MSTDSNADSNAASVRASISRRKLAANRRNARKSTGPRTPDGKRIAAMNGRSHGLFCRDLILPGENREQFIHLWNSIQSTLRAQNLLELSLVSRFVQAQWKLLRVQSAEAALHEMAEQEIVEKAHRQLAKLAEQESYRRHSDPNLQTLLKTQVLQTQTLIEGATQGKILGAALLAPSLRRAGGGCSGARERLSQYEQRIEGSGMRALSMLLKLRKQMAEQPNEPSEAPQYLIDGDAIENDPSLATAMEEMQNEPTAEESSVTDAPAEGCEAVESDTGVPPMMKSDDAGTGRTPASLEGSDEAPPTRSD